MAHYTIHYVIGDGIYSRECMKQLGKSRELLENALIDLTLKEMVLSVFSKYQCSAGLDPDQMPTSYGLV